MARSSEREERGFRYQRRPKEDLRERANMKGGSFDTLTKPKYKVFKVKDGKNLIRILPPTWDGAKHYGLDMWVNYGIGVDNQSYLSLSKMKNAKDPIAEARREAERSGDKDLVKALQPRQRILMWVIDRNDEDEGPQLFLAPFTVDKALASLCFDEDTKEVMYIDDPKEGCDVRFYKEGSGLKTDYPAEKMRILKPSPLHDDKGLAREWLEYIAENPLPDCLQFYDYDHIATTFDGQARVERDDDDEDEKPRSRLRSRDDDDEDEKPRKRAVADDDEDEKPRRRAINGADDEEEETPRRARAKVDDDDDEPRSTRRRTDIDSEGEPEGRSKPSRSRLRDADEDAEEDEKPRRAKVVDDDDEADEKPRGSIRDRLSRGRRQIDDED